MNTPPTAITGIVLAGGHSRRMGQDKAVLRLGGTTLLGHAQALLAACGCSPVLLCGNRPGALPDRQPFAGPLAGLDSALQFALTQRAPGLLLVPVDMPLLDCPVLLPLIEAGLAQQRVAHYNGHPLPLYCPATLALATLCEQQLRHPDQRQHALHAFATAANARVLDAGNATAKLDNINTPDDWQQLLATQQDMP